MAELKKEQIIASSSAWVGVLLNFIPGIGTGYLYQRRWKAYWITNLCSTLWIYIDLIRQSSIDPSDPLASLDKMSGLFGIIIISSISAIEAYLTVKRERALLENKIQS